MEGKVARPLTAEEWAAQENERGHLCACGCGENVVVKPRHRAPSVGIPRFIHDHHKMDMAKFVEALGAEGYVTVGRAASDLGISRNTLRRAEAKGWVTPEWRKWGERRPMRVYARGAVGKLRAQMVEAGFRFKDEDGVLTTKKMAAELGISESYLRWLEKRGVVPSPERDTANRRKWLRADTSRLKRRLARS